MKRLLKTFALIGLVTAPAAASAEANCSRSGLAGDWRMISINPNGSTSACDLSFDSRGQMTGNCYSVEFVDQVPTQHYEPAIGSLRMNDSCGITGSITIGSQPTALTVDLTGRAWASRNTRPFFASATGMVTLQGFPIVLGMEMHRRVWNSDPVPVAP